MATKKVSITDSSFCPDSVEVKVGDTVEWKNDGKQTHKLVFDSPGQGKSSDLSPGATHSQVFSQAGTFPYHCEKHPEMTGEVVVS